MSGYQADRDLRVKIRDRTDQVLAGLAHARGIDKQDLVREVLDAWAEKTIHESNVVRAFVAVEGSPGSAGERRS